MSICADSAHSVMYQHIDVNSGKRGGEIDDDDGDDDGHVDDDE